PPPRPAGLVAGAALLDAPRLRGAGRVAGGPGPPGGPGGGGEVRWRLGGPRESLEAGGRREVLEEAGMVVGAVEYRGSQPWPFPASIMLGFRAHAETTELRRDGVELAEARWWPRDEFTADLASGGLLVPPSVSIARRLIEDWYGGPLDRPTQSSGQLVHPRRPREHAP